MAKSIIIIYEYDNDKDCKTVLGIKSRKDYQDTILESIKKNLLEQSVMVINCDIDKIFKNLSKAVCNDIFGGSK